VVSEEREVVMEVVEMKVNGVQSTNLPWEEVVVMPIGDVQLGSDGVDIERFKKHIAWGIKNNAYFLGMGDYIDLMSPSNRIAYKNSKLYDSVRSAMQGKADELEKEFCRLVKGTEGRWLGLLEGHHYFEYEDGSTSDTRIAKSLLAPFLGTCAFVRLRFKPTTSKRSLSCTIWCHHGQGHGVFPYSPLPKLYHVMNSFEADIYLIGHQTKKPVVKAPRIYMSDREPYRLVARSKVLAGTGGFSKGYEQGSKHYNGVRAQGSYVEQGMLSPVALGGIVLKVRPVYGNKGKADRIDLNVEV